MLECCSLYSGSTGNSFFVQNDDTKILIDVGVSCKKIEDALLKLNICINDINGILITHEHIDHTKCLGTLSSKYNIPVYTNKKTWNSIGETKLKINPDNINHFKNMEEFTIGSLKIFPFSTPHDAADPCGFNISYKNKKITIATDLGHITSDIMKRFENSSCLMIESNYDPDILKFSSYPYNLKQRISGPNGHLPNFIAGKTIAELSNQGLKDVLLIHLSKENNFPELAYKTVSEELSKFNILDSINLNVAPRNDPSKMFKIS